MPTEHVKSTGPSPKPINSPSEGDENRAGGNPPTFEALAHRPKRPRQDDAEEDGKAPKKPCKRPDNFSITLHQVIGDDNQVHFEFTEGEPRNQDLEDRLAQIEAEADELFGALDIFESQNIFTKIREEIRGFEFQKEPVEEDIKDPEGQKNDKKMELAIAKELPAEMGRMSIVAEAKIGTARGEQSKHERH